MNLVKPELGLIFWMTVTFLIVFFLMKKYAWGPILKMIHDREESIETALASAEKAKEDTVAKEEYQAKLAEEIKHNIK